MALNIEEWHKKWAVYEEDGDELFYERNDAPCEGWSLFITNDEEIQLEADADFPELCKDDEQAALRVCRGVKAGSELHVDTLALLAVHSYYEYLRIVNTGRAHGILVTPPSIPHGAVAKALTSLTEIEKDLQAPSC